MRNDTSDLSAFSKRGVQSASEFNAAVASAWADPDLDPTLSNNAARTPSGQGCCACYGNIRD